MLPIVEHLGCHVLKCATERLPLLLVDVALLISHHIGLASPAKVTDLDPISLTNEQVLRFQVPMDEAVLMEEIYPGGRLNEEPKCLRLGQSLAFGYPFEQVKLGHVLHHEVDIVRIGQV